jgi:putative DNA primase/helicase
MLDAALTYASLGWYIFPIYPLKNRICSCPKGHECKSPGKHPIAKFCPAGLKNAQAAPAIISHWWKVEPKANIGIVTGSVNNLFVVDIDTKHDGDEHLKEFEKTHGSILPDDYTGCVKTGSGGYHYYYRYPKNQACKNKAGLITGLDIRADGGYVVAPPSKHYSGGTYEWEI